VHPFIASVSRGLVSLVLPPCCPVCGRRLEGTSLPCEACHRELETLWAGAGRRSGGGAPIAALLFSGAARTLVHRMKYEGDRPAAEMLAALMAARLESDVPVDPATILVPVPLHPVRMRERGYNQAERLAKGVGRRLRLDVRPGALCRVRAGPSQTTLDPEARLASASGAFRGRGGGSGRPVLVVDDVWTTGATAGACREALREAGWTGPVGTVVAARAPLAFELETPEEVC
jgi:ComF family protein